MFPTDHINPINTHPHTTESTHNIMDNNNATATANDIATVNNILDQTVPQVLSEGTQKILRGEMVNVFTERTGDLEAAINELLRREKVDQRTIKAITEARTALNEKVNLMETDHRAFRARVDKDFSTISEVLGDAATENNICGEYEETLDKLNRMLSTGEIEGRTKDFTVTVCYSFTIESRDEDGARELFLDDPSTYLDNCEPYNMDVEED